MSTATLTTDSLALAHCEFLAALPVMERAIRLHLRRVPRRLRAEAFTDAQAAAWHAWYGLLRRGKDPAAVGPTGLARNACRYVLADRKLGTGTPGRHADIFSRRARDNGRPAILSLDQPAGHAWAGREIRWCDWLAQDRAYGPADLAAFKLDFTEWLGTLTPRKREMAGLLAEGHETHAVAQRLGVTPAAVSIARRELEKLWVAFQGQDVSVGPPRRP